MWSWWLWSKPDSDCNSGSYCHSNPYTNGDAGAEPNSDADNCSLAQCYSDADSDPDSDPNPDLNTDANTNPDAVRTRWLWSKPDSNSNADQ